MVQIFVFDRLVDDDSLMGDKSGPFDPAVQARLRRIRNLVRTFLLTFLYSPSLSYHLL